MRLNSANALLLSAKKNIIIDNEEAECGAVTTDDLGKLSYICMCLIFIL